MKKMLLALSAVMLAATVSAADIELQPGSTKQVTNNTTEFQSANSDLSLTFSENNTGIYTTAPEDYSPTTGQINLKYNNSTSTKTVKILPVSNWTVQKTSSKSNVSVGNTGELLTYNITQNGNIDEDISVSATGNISDYIVFDSNVVARKGIEKQISIDYQIPSDTGFGRYNGTINFTGDSYSSNLSVETVFKDGITPEIQNISTPDLMATEKPEIKVVATDNLNIDSVTGNISKLNESSGNYLDFKDGVEFSKKENTDTWIYQLQDTDEKGKYRLDVQVVDEADNSVQANSTYSISRLNVTQVLNSNFRFDDVWPESDERRSLLENTQEVDSNITLVSTDVPDAAEVSFRILYPGEEQPTEIEEGETLQISKTGEYELVVDTGDHSFNQTKEYSGVLNISVPEQHIPVPQVDFGGDLRTDNDPKPRSLSIGQFRGRLTYLDSANASLISDLFSEIEGSENGLAVYVGSVNRENCQGSTEWSDEGCTGLSIGELEDQKNKTEQWRDEVNKTRDGRLGHWLILGSTTFFLVLGVFVNHAVKDYQRKNLFYPVWRTRQQKR